MTPIREELSDHYPDLLVMDPSYLDAAIVGVVTRIGLEAVCYSTEKVIDLLMKHDGMEYEEAVEYINFNMKGAWMGETTPVFLE
jgi:hypothetical protein